MLLSQFCFSFPSLQLPPFAWRKMRVILLTRTCRKKNGANG